MASGTLLESSVVDLSIYREWRNSPLTASGYPVKPPTEWFRPQDLKLLGPTPITVLASGQIFGHIALWGQQHTGYDRPVHPPRSRSNYAYFHTGQVLTADGTSIPVGNLTYAGGHAPVADPNGNAVSAAAAVAHYDNTGSSFADVVAYEDAWGILVAGAMRPSITDEQLRTILASAPSGDWRPINGALEMIAVCQVNVPGFPVVRALAASGALVASATGQDSEPELLALVAAGAPDMYALRLAQLSKSNGLDTDKRITELEKKLSTLTASHWSDVDTVWSEDQARESLFDHAQSMTDDVSQYKSILSSAFLVVSGSGEHPEDYKLPVAICAGGRISYVWDGISTAIRNLGGDDGVPTPGTVETGSGSYPTITASLSPTEFETACNRVTQLHSEGCRELGLGVPLSASAAQELDRRISRLQFELHTITAAGLPAKPVKKIKKKLKKLLKAKKNSRTTPAFPSYTAAGAYTADDLRNKFASLVASMDDEMMESSEDDEAAEGEEEMPRPKKSKKKKKKMAVAASARAEFLRQEMNYLVAGGRPKEMGTVTA